MNLIAAPGLANAAPGWCCGSSLPGLSAAKCQESLTVVCAGSLSPFFFPAVIQLSILFLFCLCSGTLVVSM